MKLCARTSTSYDPLLVRRRRSWCWSTTTAPSRKLWWLPPGILQHPPRPASFFYYKPAPPLGPQWNPRVRLEPPSLELPFPRQPEHLQIGPASHEMGGRDDCRSSSRGRALAERNITVKCLDGMKQLLSHLQVIRPQAQPAVHFRPVPRSPSPRLETVY